MTSIEDKDLNLLALLPCPIKVPLEEAFNTFVANLNEGDKSKLKYLIESNANNFWDYKKNINSFEKLEDIPDIVISTGINDFFSRRFTEKFIKKNLFIDAADYIPNKTIKEAGIKDPLGNYTVLSMNLLVMVADLTKMEELPIPEKWGDLLKAEYHKKVVIRGHKNNFCETTLLTIFKEYGYEGIKVFGKNVMAGWHPAQMVKCAGTGKEDAPAISVMPYFYAKTIKNQDKVKIIWPKDGAIVSPVTMLVKKSKLQDLKYIADFFTGPIAADIYSKAYFPAVNPEVNNKIPEGAALNWIGWDFIRANDIEKIVSDLNKCFNEGFNS